MGASFLIPHALPVLELHIMLCHMTMMFLDQEAECISLLFVLGLLPVAPISAWDIEEHAMKEA
jgi:hypothetical protein